MATNTTKTTKKDQLVRMLRAKSGTDAGTISRKLGWQVHTTRAAITGLRKAGYDIAVEKAETGKPTRYRIVSAPTTGSAAAKARPAAEPANAG